MCHFFSRLLLMTKYNCKMFKFNQLFEGIFIKNCICFVTELYKKSPENCALQFFGAFFIYLSFLFVFLSFFLFVVMCFIPVHKFINTTCRVNQFHFTGKKWMRGI